METLPMYSLRYDTNHGNVLVRRNGSLEDVTTTRYTLEEFHRTLVEESCDLAIYACLENSAYPRYLSLEQIVSKFPGVRTIMMVTEHWENFSCLSLCRNLHKLDVKIAAQTEMTGLEFADSIRDLTINTIRPPSGECFSEPLTLENLDGMMLDSLTICPGVRPIRVGKTTFPCLKRLALAFCPDIIETIREVQIPTSCEICFVYDEWWRDKAQKIRREIYQLFPDNISSVTRRRDPIDKMMVRDRKTVSPQAKYRWCGGR